MTQIQLFTNNHLYENWIIHNNKIRYYNHPNLKLHKDLHFKVGKVKDPPLKVHQEQSPEV